MPYKFPSISRVDGGDNHYDLVLDSAPANPTTANIIPLPKGRKWNAVLQAFDIFGTTNIDITLDPYDSVAGPNVKDGTARFVNYTGLFGPGYVLLGSPTLLGVTALRLWSDSGISPDLNVGVCIGLERGGI